MSEKREPKIGDTVWVKLPMNAVIKRINKRRGYTLQTEDGQEWRYFTPEEIDLI